MDLYHKTVGAFGLDAIGHQVVKHLEGFECKILGYDILVDEGYYGKEGICLSSPQEVFKRADITTLHVPGNADETRFIIQQELELMEPEAVLVNTARAPLIDETAMVQVLWQKRIYGYETDVFDGEPYMNPEFVGLNNVVCSPHTAAANVEAVNIMPHTAVKHLMEYFGVTKWQEKPYMKHIVWTRIDDRLIHGQVMTRWTQYTEASEVLIIDDGVTRDSFLQMVMESSVPGKISLEVLSVKDIIGYLDEDGKHEKTIILVKIPVALGGLSDAGACLKSINVGGTDAKAGRKPTLKNISVSGEEKEAFRNLLNKGISVLLRIIVTEPEGDIAKYLQKESSTPMHIRSSQIVYRR